MQLLEVTLTVTAELDEERLIRLDAYEALHDPTKKVLTAQQALVEERARYQDLFDFAPDGYLVTDLCTRIVQANLAAGELLGTDRQSLIGERLTRYAHADDRQKLAVEVERIAAEDECAMVFEIRFQPLDGSTMYGEVKVTRSGRQGSAGARLLWLIRDVTEQVEVRQALARRNKELLALASELDAFAHTVAHDLKQPMALIMGFASLLVEELGNTLDEQQQTMVMGIVRGTRRMANLVEALLLLANTRKNEVAIDALDMEAIVFRVISNLARQIDELGAQVIVPEAWPMAMGYAPWVESVWANYVSNALKYGGRPPHVTLGAEIISAGSVRFWVRDNGEGLTEADQGRLFAEFSRLDAGKKPGHGLGLTIVRRIVERLGGRVGVESIVGEGSTFWFTLPSES